MKIVSHLLVSFIFLIGLGNTPVFGQSTVETVFSVSGPCMECGATRLETVAKEIPGVIAAKYEAGKLKVSYEKSQTSEIDIQLELSFKGYNAGDFGFTPDPNLPECCRKTTGSQPVKTQTSIPLGGTVNVSEVKETKPTTPEKVFEAPKQGPAPGNPKVNTGTTSNVTRGEITEEEDAEVDDYQEEADVLLEDDPSTDSDNDDLLLGDDEPEEEGSDLWADDVNDEWGGWYDENSEGSIQKEEGVDLDEISEEDRSSVSSGPANKPMKESSGKLTPEEIEKQKREARLKAAKESIEAQNKPK